MFAAYIPAQLAAVIFSGKAGMLLIPWWHLWFLLSASFWATVGGLWYRFGRGKGKLLILFFSVLLSSLSGFVPWINRTLSISRTIAFFPFFWVGLICKKDIMWRKYYKMGFVSLSASAILLLIFGEQIPCAFLYNAEPYGIIKNGWMLRVFCSLLSAMLIFCLLTVIPNKRFAFTCAGANTMPHYLLHAPIVRIIRKTFVPWPFCVLYSALVIYTIHKILKWTSLLCGIVQEEEV